MNERTNKWMNDQPTERRNEWANQWMNVWMCESVVWMGGSVGGSLMDGRMHGCMDGSFYCGWMHACMVVHIMRGWARSLFPAMGQTLAGEHQWTPNMVEHVIASAWNLPSFAKSAAKAMKWQAKWCKFLQKTYTIAKPCVSSPFQTNPSKQSFSL